MTRRSMLNITAAAPLAAVSAHFSPPASLHDRMQAAFEDVTHEPIDTVKEWSLAVKDVDAFDNMVAGVGKALDAADTKEKKTNIIGWAIVCAVQAGREVGK